MSTTSAPRVAAQASAQVDPRGQRFAASLTVVVLAVVLLTAPSGLATGLLAAQAALFATAVALGVQRTPVAWLYRTVVRPRFGPPAETEDAAPPRFAQAVGLAFAAVGLVGFLTGATALGLVATAFALAAALLNAAFGFCLGCEMYLLLKRATA
ncbi:DUF4395 domain-containing protein [Nocardioides perillae]|uniref:DUF4395 domain-containing protein n=1 Tax=Nocardioides perillae TaxID=1119534 RepID=A0A7Y9UJW5_9ACTN|nr:DUF4395 domain-containing protein [Nocardioides perillae]NYG54688.1 hypothetical protein [Nocardioides perillae]